MKRFVVTQTNKVIDLLRESSDCEIIVKDFDTPEQANDYALLRKIGLVDLWKK